jgi:hypothetical protein
VFAVPCLSFRSGRLKTLCALQLSHLSSSNISAKRYGNTVAADAANIISMSIVAGEIVGFLGATERERQLLFECYAD